MTQVELPSAATLSKAFDEGRLAGSPPRRRVYCPYSHMEHDLRAAWFEGVEQGRKGSTSASRQVTSPDPYVDPRALRR